MKSQRVLALGLIVLASACLPASAQQRVKRTDPNTYYRAPHTLTGKMIILPIGTTFEGRLNKTLSSAKSHAGESFSLVLSSPVLSNGIDVIIPAGAQVMGEVVEAISSHAQPRKKRMPPPRGKLRVQINQLRTPDGTSFPLVANLVGEDESRRGGRSGLQTPLGSGVGFVGTAESFEAVAPGANRYGKSYGQSGRGPEKEYVHKRQFLADEIYGMGDEQRFPIEDRRIRSLVLKKNDLYIDEGSPLTVRLAAPLRLSVSPVNSGAPVGSVEESSGGGDDLLPGPSPRSAGADIPPLTGRQDAPPPEPKRRKGPPPSAVEDAPGEPSAAPPQASQPARSPAQPPSPSSNQQPVPPPASPSSDF